MPRRLAPPRTSPASGIVLQERTESSPAARTVATAIGDAAQTWIGHSLQVLVRDNNIDQALRALKKKMQREGIFREMKQRRAYEKPSERRTREKAEAVRRARKAARKQAQREGLIPAPKRRQRVSAAGARPRP